MDYKKKIADGAKKAYDKWKEMDKGKRRMIVAALITYIWRKRKANKKKNEQEKRCAAPADYYRGYRGNG